MTIREGQSVSVRRTVSDEDVRRFAELSGDTNPVHLDDEVARRSRFGRRVAHGMLAASWISAVLGTELPGPGSIYLGQTLRFKAPLFIGETVTVEVAVTTVRTDKPIATLSTRVVGEDGDVRLEGEATILVDAA